MSVTVRRQILAAISLLALLAAVFFRPDILIGLGQLSQSEARRIWSTPYFHLGDQPVTLIFLLTVVLFFAVLAVLARSVRRFVRRHILDRTALDEGQRFAIEKVTAYFVFVMGLLVGLQSTGLNLTSLAFLGGAIGIVIGFGLQNISSNFVSGLILLVERPIKVGDRIEVGGLNGDVTRIGARSTWIRTNDNIVIIVPNSDFISNRVINWTANDRQVRFSMLIGVSYGSDPLQVREILQAVSAAHPDVLQDPPPETLFVGFGESSLDFELRVWTMTQVQTPGRLKSDLYFALFDRFRKEGIEIPFPQRDLHLKSVSSSASSNLGARVLVSQPTPADATLPLQPSEGRGPYGDRDPQ